MVVPVIAFGLGPIGARICTRLLARKGQVDVVAAIDADPGKIGRSLADLLGIADSTALHVASDAPMAPVGGGVAIQATSSDLGLAARQAMQLARLGWNVLSTCEELAAPAAVDSGLAAELDAVARAAGVSILATGINPGFMMDTLPIILTAVCTRVERISIRRVVNTDERREQLQRKAGVGIDPAEFNRLAAQGRIGHVGLKQSVNLIANRLGWQLTGVDVTLEPIVAGEPLTTSLGTVAKGSVVGQHQVGLGYVRSREAIRLDLVMAAGERSVDEIAIVGEPNVSQRIEGGVNGDVGTEAVIANVVRPLYNARPGMLTMGDMVAVVCETASAVPLGTSLDEL